MNDSHPSYFPKQTYNQKPKYISIQSYNKEHTAFIHIHISERPSSANHTLFSLYIQYSTITT